MQVLLPGKPVKEQTTKGNLLEILADKYSRMILESTIDMPKSAIDLSNDYGIPISTRIEEYNCYTDTNYLESQVLLMKKAKSTFCTNPKSGQL